MLGDDRKIEHEKSVMKMKMLRWMTSLTREDRIKNKYVRGSI